MWSCDFELPDALPSWGEMTLVVFYHYRDFFKLTTFREAGLDGTAVFETLI